MTIKKFPVTYYQLGKFSEPLELENANNDLQ